jgi:hypothetical protein
VTASCSDLEQALRGDDPALGIAFRTHALACEACREELALWDGISAAAPGLRKEWPSPELAARIRADLRSPVRPMWRPPTAVFVALAAAACLVIGLLIWQQRSPDPATGGVATAVPPDLEAERLMSEKALAEVEQAQKAYVQAIDALSKVAAPRLANEGSAVFSAYREKLLVLDSAIEECRAQAEQNRFNAHLRLELLSIYQEKQRTLESLLHEDPHAS